MKNRVRHRDGRMEVDHGNHIAFSIVVIDETGDHLEETLSSLIHQRYPEFLFDVFVVTDASAMEVFKCLHGSRMPVLTIPLRESGGISRAIGKCVEKAGGEVLLFTRSDEVVPPDWLEVHDRRLRELFLISLFRVAAGTVTDLVHMKRPALLALCFQRLRSKFRKGSNIPEMMPVRLFDPASSFMTE